MLQSPPLIYFEIILYCCPEYVAIATTGIDTFHPEAVGERLFLRASWIYNVSMHPFAP
jgi:hypothetical protein